jgi:lipoate-protein ligase B
MPTRVANSVCWQSLGQRGSDGGVEMQERVADTLLCLQHAPVYTAGTRGGDKDFHVTDAEVCLFSKQRAVTSMHAPAVAHPRMGVAFHPNRRLVHYALCCNMSTTGVYNCMT